MPNVALVPYKATRIPVLELLVDGYPETRHKLSVETGGHPVEDGTLVQDHATARAERLELTAWISDQGSFTPTKARDAWAELRRIHRDTEIVEVITDFGRYPEMIITSAEAEEAGAGLRVELRLGQVIRVGEEPGEIVPGKAAGPAAERPSLTPRGLVAAASQEVLTGTVPGSAAQRLVQTVPSGQFPGLQPLVANLPANPAAAADLAETVKRKAREAAKNALLKRLREALLDRACDYLDSLTNQVGKAVIERDMVKRILEGVPGITDFSYAVKYVQKGIEFSVEVESVFGDVEFTHTFDVTECQR